LDGRASRSHPIYSIVALSAGSHHDIGEPE